jgi:hypothetical protein
MKLALSTRCEISTGTQEWCEGKGTDFHSGVLPIAMAVGVKTISKPPKLTIS